MKATDRDAYYWKSEYEAIRRRLTKENKKIKQIHHNFIIRTWGLLKALGMKEEDIIKFYDRTD